MNFREDSIESKSQNGLSRQDAEKRRWFCGYITGKNDLIYVGAYRQIVDTTQGQKCSKKTTKKCCKAHRALVLLDNQ